MRRYIFDKPQLRWQDQQQGLLHNQERDQSHSLQLMMNQYLHQSAQKEEEKLL